MGRYLGAASAVSLGWYIVLLIPRTTREFLLDPELWFLNLVLMVTAGVAVAVLFRISIVTPRLCGVVPALFLPLVGAFIFAVLYSMLLAGLNFWNVGRVGDWREFVGVIYRIMVGTLYALYIVIPMGFVSQWIMRRFGLECERRWEGRPIR